MKYIYHCNLLVTKDGFTYTPVDLVLEDSLQLSLQTLKIKVYKYLDLGVISFKDLTYTMETRHD
jgi:hypothetical protein